jgi:hypothetical protein
MDAFDSLCELKTLQAAAIHGDISQGQRTAAVEGFKSGKVSSVGNFLPLTRVSKHFFQWA